MNSSDLDRRRFVSRFIGGMVPMSLLPSMGPTPFTNESNPAFPRSPTLKLALISAASYATPGEERKSGSNHGTAFATIFNGWDEEESKNFSGTMIKSTRQIPDCVVTKVWDPLPEAAKRMAAACKIETVCPTPQACCDDVDAVILIDDGSGRQWQYAEHPLRRGIPVFCDKPLAMTAREAQKVAQVAEETGTKLMSASSLRFVPDIVNLRQELDGLGNIKLAMATGPGQLLYYGIHALSMVYGVLGGGVRSVQHVGTRGRHVLRLRYAHDLETLLIVTEQEHFPMGYQLQLFGDQGSRMLVPDLTDLYVYLLQAFVGYLRTGQAPFPVSEEVELIAVLEAGERSLASGQEVLVSDVMET
jgi:predicted dehydrogenase